jgi:hypothetical protein
MIDSILNQVIGSRVRDYQGILGEHLTLGVAAACMYHSGFVLFFATMDEMMRTPDSLIYDLMSSVNVYRYSVCI